MLGWVVDRLHGFNRWTVRVLWDGPMPEGWRAEPGWSALSWWGGEVALERVAFLARFRRLIDWWFGEGHCQREYVRCVEGRPLELNGRETAAALVLGAAIFVAPLTGVVYLIQ